MLKSMKKGLGDMKANAEIETEYLSAKNKKNFDHPAEIGARIKGYQEALSATEEYYDRVKAWADRYQELINSEQKMIDRMTTSAVTLGALATVFGMFTSGEQNLVQMRTGHLGKVTEYIITPLKKFIAEQAPIKEKIDKANKSWIELRYWRKKGSHAKEENESKTEYDEHTDQLNKMFDANIDSHLSSYVKFFADFELEFLQAAINVAPRVQ
eukprot:TRINITY_DN590_c0_g1_i1.p1 TRINITY_DN590_c0_g1~~TRINITY_DN590_c0_g1_i1.p1  ORF type:complete len:212 (+),score=99.43 TRINITY_DN590_c0_g1_i1:55-690(+)